MVDSELVTGPTEGAGVAGREPCEHDDYDCGGDSHCAPERLDLDALEQMVALRGVSRDEAWLRGDEFRALVAAARRAERLEGRMGDQLLESGKMVNDQNEYIVALRARVERLENILRGLWESSVHNAGTGSEFLQAISSTGEPLPLAWEVARRYLEETR